MLLGGVLVMKLLCFTQYLSELIYVALKQFLLVFKVILQVKRDSNLLIGSIRKSTLRCMGSYYPAIFSQFPISGEQLRCVM